MIETTAAYSRIRRTERHALRGDVPTLEACGHRAETDWDVSTAFAEPWWPYQQEPKRSKRPMNRTPPPPGPLGGGPQVDQAAWAAARASFQACGVNSATASGEWVGSRVRTSWRYS